MTAAPHADVASQISAILAGHEVVDLTLPLAEELPGTWPGHMPFRATVWTWFADRPDDPQPVHPRTGGSYQTRWLVIDEHTGTHLDAPRHFVPPPGSRLPRAGPGGEIGVDKLPLLAAATADAVGWLHERGVRCLGTDGLSIGPAGNSAPTHLAGLTRGMVFVEALAGLSALPPRGAWFLFLPLHLVDGTGAPGRALAVLP